MRPDDRKAFEQLQCGSNVGGLHLIQHYLYFPDELTAKDVGRVLSDMGYTVEVRLGADDINWLLLATTRAVPTDRTITAMCTTLERIANQNRGEYDGWEAEVQERPK